MVEILSTYENPAGSEALRRQIAERYRSEGNGEAARIRGNRVRDLNKIQSEAYREVEEIRGVADAKAQLFAYGLGAFWTDILGQRAGGLHALTLITPEDVAHTGQTLFLRPRVHAVAEFAAAACRRRNGADFVAGFFQHRGKDLEA